jgi:hypothetical protein
VFLTTQLLTIMSTLIDGLLLALSTRPAGALLTTPTIELWTASSGGINPNSTYGQFTTATFSGYVKAALTLTGPVTVGGNVQAMIANATFIATTGGPFVPNNILGYILSDGVSVLYAAEQFTNVVPIAGPGSFLDFNFVFPIGNLQPL